jgi:hypothetical protein
MRILCTRLYRTRMIMCLCCYVSFIKYLFSHTHTIAEYPYAITYWWNSGILGYNILSFNTIFSSFLNNFGKCGITEFKFENTKEEDLMNLDRRIKFKNLFNICFGLIWHRKGTRDTLFWQPQRNDKVNKWQGVYLQPERILPFNGLFCKSYPSSLSNSSKTKFTILTHGVSILSSSWVGKLRGQPF